MYSRASCYSSCVLVITVHTIASIQTKRYRVPCEDFSSWGYRSHLDRIKVCSITIHSQAHIRAWGLRQRLDWQAEMVYPIHRSNKLAWTLVKRLADVYTDSRICQNSCSVACGPTWIKCYDLRGKIQTSLLLQLLVAWFSVHVAVDHLKLILPIHQVVARCFVASKPQRLTGCGSNKVL